MLRSSAFTAIAFVFVMTSPALAAMGVPEDSSGNHRPPDMSTRDYSTATESDYDVAKRLLRHKQYAEAIPHLQFALADKPQDADILNDLGYAKRMVGNYDDALYYDQRAITIEPGHKGAHENMGELYLLKNDLLSAQKELETLTTLCPSDCDERTALAQAIANFKPAGARASGGAMPASASAPQ